MTFQHDTSGFVRPYANRVTSTSELIYWSDLDPFTQGYVVALFADLAAKRIEALGGVFGPAFRYYVPAKFSDLAPETLARIVADCARAASEPRSPLLGRRFWEQRQRAMLADFPPMTPTLGDDLKVRFGEAGQ